MSNSQFQKEQLEYLKNNSIFVEVNFQQTRKLFEQQ